MVWLYTSTLLLDRIGLGDFFRSAFRQADLSSAFVSQSLALYLLFLSAACFSGVVD